MKSLPALHSTRGDRARPLKRAATMAAGAALASLLAAAPAAAACSRLSFSAFPSTVNWRGSTGTGYDVFDAADRVQSVAFAVTKRSGSCNYFITATTLGGDTFTNRQLTGGGNALGFNVYTTASRSNIIRDLPSAGPNDVLAGSFGPGGQATNSMAYYFDIPPQQAVPPDNYSATMQFKLFQGDLFNNTLAQIIQVRQQARVLATTEIAFVSPGQAFDPSKATVSLDLGVLNMGGTALRQAATNLQLRTNDGYVVTLQSQNRGVLRLSQGDPSWIPYLLTINGAPAFLLGGAPIVVATAGGTTGASGISLPIVVTVDPALLAHLVPSAGTYSDVITVSASAR